MPLPRFHLRTHIVSVAAVAVGAGLLHAYSAAGQRGMILITAVVSAAFGLGALRSPLVTLAIGIPLGMFWLRDLSSSLPLLAAMLGWIMGAPVGWATRFVRRMPGGATEATPRPATPEGSNPDRRPQTTRPGLVGMGTLDSIVRPPLNRRRALGTVL